MPDRDRIGLLAWSIRLKCLTLAASRAWKRGMRPIDPSLDPGRKQAALRAEMPAAGVMANLGRLPSSAFWLPDWSARYLVGPRHRIAMIRGLQTDRNSAVPQIADVRQATTASGLRAPRSTSVLLHRELLCSAKAVTVSCVRARCPMRDPTLAFPGWPAAEPDHFEVAAAAAPAGIEVAAARACRGCDTRTNASTG